MNMPVENKVAPVTFTIGEKYGEMTVIAYPGVVSFYYKGGNSHIFDVCIADEVEVTSALATLMVSCFHSGKYRGKEEGKAEAQLEIRKALGMEK